MHYVPAKVLAPKHSCKSGHGACQEPRAAVGVVAEQSSGGLKDSGLQVGKGQAGSAQRPYLMPTLVQVKWRDPTGPAFWERVGRSRERPPQGCSPSWAVI